MRSLFSYEYKNNIGHSVSEITENIKNTIKLLSQSLNHNGTQYGH